MARNKQADRRRNDGKGEGMKKGLYRKLQKETMWWGDEKGWKWGTCKNGDDLIEVFALLPLKTQNKYKARMIAACKKIIQRNIRSNCKLYTNAKSGLGGDGREDKKDRKIYLEDIEKCDDWITEFYACLDLDGDERNSPHSRAYKKEVKLRARDILKEIPQLIELQ